MADFGKYFTYASMYRSSAATKAGVDNTPTPAAKRNLKQLVTKILDPLRESIGHPIIVNSGYRNAATNKLVGGVSTSAHVSGYAVDIICPVYGNPKKFCEYVAKFLNDNKIAFDQVIHEYNGWVHVGLKHPDGRQRKQVITINRNGTFPGIR